MPELSGHDITLLRLKAKAKHRILNLLPTLSRRTCSLVLKLWIKHENKAKRFITVDYNQYEDKYWCLAWSPTESDHFRWSALAMHFGSQSDGFLPTETLSTASKRRCARDLPTNMWYNVFTEHTLIELIRRGHHRGTALSSSASGRWPEVKSERRPTAQVWRDERHRPGATPHSLRAIDVCDHIFEQKFSFESILNEMHEFMRGMVSKASLLRLFCYTILNVVFDSILLTTKLLPELNWNALKCRPDSRITYKWIDRNIFTAFVGFARCVRSVGSVGCEPRHKTCAHHWTDRQRSGSQCRIGRVGRTGRAMHLCQNNFDLIISVIIPTSFFQMLCRLSRYRSQFN